MTATIAAIYAVSILALLAAILSAPEGYEDADGFHIGREPRA